MNRKMKSVLMLTALTACTFWTAGCAESDSPSAEDQGLVALNGLLGVAPNGLATHGLVAPVDAEGGGGGGGGSSAWWPQPQNGASYGWTSGEDRGDCLLLCTKGNYNQAFKRNLCNAGRSPGVNPVFYNGHYQFWGLKWDKMGTGQDHQGVCVTTHKADVGGTGTAATRKIFHDGCTGFPDGQPRRMTKGPNSGWTPANWGQAFHGACIIHDLCYKAEPSFSGKSKDYCDDQMEIAAKKICNASYGTGGGGFLKKNDINKCLAEAGNARFWLKSGSDNHYTGFNYPFDWRPTGLCGSGKTYDVVTNTCVTN